MNMFRLGVVIFLTSFIFWLVPRVEIKVVSTPFFVNKTTRPMDMGNHFASYVKPVNLQIGAYQREANCMQEALFFEAGDQPSAAKYMVGMVILERVNSDKYANSVCGVVHQAQWMGNVPYNCQFSYYCSPHEVNWKNPVDVTMWKKCGQIAQVLLSKQFLATIKGKRLTNYHANYIHPYWSRSNQFKKFAVVGDQTFYMAEN